MNNNFDSRDKLFLERTRLAIERTLLAYIRMGLSLLAASGILFQFFSSIHAYTAIAWILAGCGLALLIIGLFRFMTVRKNLNG